MNSRKTFYVLCAVFVLLVGALVATLVVGNSRLKQQSDDLRAVKLDQKSLSEQQTALVRAKKDLAKYEELHEIAQSIVPQDKDQARAVREIDRYAQESGVSIQSITFDDSTLGRQPVQPQAKQNAGPSEGQTNPTPQPTAPANPITQAKPVPNIPGVYSMPIIIKSSPNANRYQNFISFLSKLENNRRTAQVEQVSIVPVPTLPGVIDFTLKINLFVKP